MKSKKIALLASILMVTLVVGVYAGFQLSKPITAEWTLQESGENLELYWASPYEEPSGTLYRGQWIYASIGLKNVGDAPYDNVIGKFKIVTGPVLPEACITIEYNEHDGTGWHDMTPVLKYNGGTVTGYFGDLAGFPVGLPYDVVASYRILFDGKAPTGVYSFEAWIEQVP